jgi:mannose-6-phosphate isomerase-like protein (cupin superfamily)
VAATDFQHVVARLRVEMLDDEPEPLGGHGLMVVDTVETDAPGSPLRRDAVAMDAPVNLQAALEAIDELWKPLTVAVVNDYDVRVVKVRGEFTWHSHPETDELFHVLSGSLTIEMAEGDVHLGAGDLYVVPRGRQHRPRSADGATVLLLEPSATVNTGDTPSHRTTERRVATTG